MIFIPTSKGVPGPRGLKGERGPGGPQVCSKIVVSVVRGRDCCGSIVSVAHAFKELSN
mgnify:CR=1 FL=1